MRSGRIETYRVLRNSGFQCSVDLVDAAPVVARQNVIRRASNSSMAWRKCFTLLATRSNAATRTTENFLCLASAMRASKPGRLALRPDTPQSRHLCLPKIPFSGFHQCNIVTLRSKLSPISIPGTPSNKPKLVASESKHKCSELHKIKSLP
jgi:hypothetical protein